MRGAGFFFRIMLQQQRKPFQPPCASTTLRQGTESCALFSRRQAFISAGLPMCSAHSASASLRQAIFACGVGPDCAEAADMPAITRASEIASDFTFVDLVMGSPFDGWVWGLKAGRKLVEARRAVHAMFMASADPPKTREFARFSPPPIFMGCWPAPSWAMYIRVGCGDRSAHRKTEETLETGVYHVEQIKMDERRDCPDGFFDSGGGVADGRARRGRGGLLQDGRCAAGLRGSHGPRRCGACRAGRRRPRGARRLCPGHSAARRLYPREPLWRAARRLHPRAALRRMIRIEPSRLEGQPATAALSGKRRGNVRLTLVPPAPEIRSRH